MEVKEIESALWDKQIEEDLKAGRLQGLLDQAKQDFESGRCDSYETPIFV